MPPRLGAPAIEIGIELAAPRSSRRDLPLRAGHRRLGAVARGHRAERVVEQTDLPKATPTETDDPDRWSRRTTPKSRKDEPKLETVQAKPPTESVAAEATATPTLQTAQEAPRSVAPAQGTGESAQRERVTWQKELAAHFNKYKRYPADGSTPQAPRSSSASCSTAAGTCCRRASSRARAIPAFDAAALAMLRRADPVPAPPPLVADDGPDLHASRDLPRQRAALIGSAAPQSEV